MFYLHFKAMDFGISEAALERANTDSVRAPYDTVEEARAQAQHNIDTQKQVPLRIVDETGKVLVDYKK